VPRWPKRKPRLGVDEYGRTPLWNKAAEGDLEAVTRAISEGADPNQGDDVGYTPLHVSIQNGHVAIVELLLNAGANPNVYDKYGNGTLCTATLTPQIALPTQVAIIRILLRAGADPDHQNAYGRTPRQIATTSTHGINDPFVEYYSGVV
jgi:ankyrin repeat protein